MKTSLLKAVALSVLLSPAYADKCKVPAQDGVKVTVGGRIKAQFNADVLAKKQENDVDTDLFAKSAHMRMSQGRVSFDIAGKSGRLHYGGKVDAAFTRDTNREIAEELSVYMGNSLFTVKLGRMKFVDEMLAKGARTFTGMSDPFSGYQLIANGSADNVEYYSANKIITGHGGMEAGEEVSKYATRLQLSTGRFFPVNGNGGVMFALSFTPNTAYRGVGEYIGKDKLKDAPKIGDKFNIAGGFNAEYVMSGFRLGLGATGAYQALPGKEGEKELQYEFTNNFEYRVDAMLGYGNANLGVSWIDRLNHGKTKENNEADLNQQGKFLMVGGNYEFANVMFKPCVNLGYALGMNKIKNPADDKAVDDNHNHIAAGLDLTLASGLKTWLSGSFKMASANKDVVADAADKDNKIAKDKLDTSAFSLRVGVGLDF